MKSTHGMSLAPISRTYRRSTVTGKLPLTSILGMGIVELLCSLNLAAKSEGNLNYFTVRYGMYEIST